MVTVIFVRACVWWGVAALYKAGKSGGDTKSFFREEYKMNYTLSKFAKPFIAYLDGVTSPCYCVTVLLCYCVTVFVFVDVDIDIDIDDFVERAKLWLLIITYIQLN